MQRLIEPLEFLKEIHKSKVRYLLIGRQAVIAYGGPVQSMDYDIFVDGSDGNISLLLKIARKYDLLPSIPIKEIKSHFKFRLENDFIVDVFRSKSLGSGGAVKITFEELYARKKVLKGDAGLELNLPSIDDLILLKELRSSPKDLQDIKYLKALK